MRIAVDGRPLCHPYTGIGVYAYEILSRMAASHELFVYLDRVLPAPLAFRATLRSESLPQLAVHFLFPRWAQRDRVDVYWGPRHNLPLALTGIPAVVTIHDMAWRQAPETMKPLNWLVDAVFMPLALARAKRILAVSTATAAQIRRFSGRRDVDVVPLAARSVEEIIPFKHPRPYFLFVGQKEPRKNLPGTIEGFHRAVTRGLKHHDLVLVGPDGWKQDELAGMIAAGDVGERIVDLGPISDARLAGLYQGCAALVLASFYEGFGIPLLEAMQQGKPVITSNAGVLSEVGGDAALLVDPGKPDRIAEAFMRLANDSRTCSRLAANARVRSRLFSWDHAARQTVDVLAAAAGRQPGLPGEPRHRGG